MNGEVVEKDVRKAFHWFEKSANLGNTGAQHIVGN